MESGLTVRKVISKVISLLFESDMTYSINNALTILINYFNVDWIYVAIIDREEKTINFMYEVKSEYGETIQTVSDSASKLPYQVLPWIISTIEQDNVIMISEMDQLPPEAGMDKQYLQTQGLQSFMMIPIKYHDIIHGFIGFDSIKQKREWKETEIEDLQIIANIFSIIIERKLSHSETERIKRQSDHELQRLRNADKLKGAFLENINHEIRTPLNAILGFSSLIAEVNDPEERMYYKNIIQENYDLLMKILSDMMDFSKIEESHEDLIYSCINLKQVCIGLKHQYKKRDQPKVKFIFNEDIHPEISVYTDFAKLMQVINNLVSNAFKFTIQGKVEIAYKVIGKNVFISVSDTGIGIDPEYHQMIFDRFTKLSSFSQGIGLGLSLCKKIIHLLDGEIGLESRPGKGSSFWISLPYSKEDCMVYSKDIRKETSRLST